jgi:hypothetical protein
MIQVGAIVLVDTLGHTCGYSVYLPHSIGMYIYVFGSAHILQDMSVSTVGQVDIPGDMNTLVTGPLCEECSKKRPNF